MKRLLTALVSATLLATFFAGTPAPTFASATENYYIGFGSGSDTGCGEPDFVVDNGNETNNANDDRLEDNLQAALDVVDDGDTIIICSGWYTLHSDMAVWDGDQNPGGAVDPINITIRGTGVNETVIDGTIEGKDFDSYTVNAFAFMNTNLTVSDLTITQVDGDYGAAISLIDGDLTIDNVNFDTYALDYDFSNKDDNYGGAVWIYDGDLTVTDSNFDATTGWNRPDGDLGDVSPVQGSGGAIFSSHENSTPNTISITGTTFSGNSADTNGGAIWAYCADATITDSEFYDNTTGSKGGAIMAKSDGSCTGELSVVESTFEGNSILGYFGPSFDKWRHMGGAVYTVGQDLTVSDSTFGADGSGNRATSGGAIAMFDGTTGTATLTVTNTDFEDNYSAGRGGAIFLACVDATITGDGEGTWDSYLDGSSSTFWSNYGESGGAIYLYGDGYDDRYCGDGTQGSLTVEGVVFDDNGADFQGGAIHTQQSAVAVENIDISDSVFYSNYAYDDGGVLNSDQVDVTIDSSLFLENGTDEDGGALEVSGDGWDLLITDSEFRDNFNDDEDGGAIYVGDMNSMTIEDSGFIENYSDEDGGAIYRSGGYEDDVIVGSQFIDNSTGNDYDAGAIWTDNSVGITNSSFIDNSTGLDGYGGAIYQNDGTLTIADSNFVGNYSWYHGGAIYTQGNGLYVSESTFKNNETRWDDGGAIYVDSDVSGRECPQDWCTRIINSDFENNEAENGGAIFSYAESLLIEDSNFIGNTSSDDGGAVNFNYEELLVKNSVFRSNKAGWGEGGAIYSEGNLDRHSVTVQGSDFIDNTVGGGTDGIATGVYSAGAIYVADIDREVVISGSSFVRNTATDDGGAVYSDGPLRIAGSSFSQNRISRQGSGGAVYANASAVIESNVMRNNSAVDDGGAVYFNNASQGSVFSRNLLDANTAYNGGGVAIFGYEPGSNRMAIHTNRIWNNVASNNGGGIWMNFTEAGALYELANNMKSNMFVRNRAVYGAAGLLEVTNVSKSNQRIFNSLTKSNKYQLNRSTMRGWDLLMIKLEQVVL